MHNQETPGLTQAFAETDAPVQRRQAQAGLVSNLLSGVLPTAAEQALNGTPQYVAAQAELPSATDDLIAGGSAGMVSIRNAVGRTLRVVGVALN